MESLQGSLVDREHQLILLLTPPFDKAEPSPVYIKGYVPGVRENGGQYTHAALWAVLAQMLLRRGDAAYELLSFINPVNRSSDREGVKRYRVEPYVVAADVYSAEGHTGRGGWTWYTGAAGWMYRVVIEHLLGIKREGQWLTIDPCLPAGWRGYTATVRIEGAEYEIEVDNSSLTGTGVESIALDSVVSADGRVRLEPGSGRHVVRAVLGKNTTVTEG
jgi:cyclic beta-1,2-glucan synthetase